LLQPQTDDFCRLHFQWIAEQKAHAGIALAQQQFPVGEQPRRLVKLASGLPAEEMNNRLEFLSVWGYSR
jgi:hypothetical protein